MKKDLSVKQMIIMAGALFSMHFGASCMLFPVTWGKESGSSVFIAYIAILLSALLLPLLGYLALAKGNGSFYSITKRIAPKFGPIFCAVTILIMGPFYVIPRMSAASFDAVAQLFGIHTNSILPIILFNCVYYVITYWFLSSKGKIVEKVGKILFPILVVMVVGVVIKGIITPISDVWIPKSYPQSPLIYGFLQGYATGDLPAALMFGLIIVQGIRSAGIPEDRINRNIVKLGVLGMGMLAITHLGHMVVGANTGGTINLSLASLYTEVVLRLWGPIGGGLFNVALICAGLTTAIGLGGSTAEYFEEALDGKYSYKKIVLVTILVSGFMSSIGLDNIVIIVGPLLDACYPATIVMVIYYVFIYQVQDLRKINGARFAMIVAAVVGFIDVLATYNTLFNINSDAFIKFYSYLPLSSVKLTWVPVSIIFFLIGMITYKETMKNNMEI